MDEVSVNKMAKKKICIVSTVPSALRLFMREHIQELSKEFDITLVANATPHEIGQAHGTDIDFVFLGVERKISVIRDMVSLSQLFAIFFQNKFDCVISIMPKTGLLAMLAGFFARIPTRIHIFTGQVWFTSTGIARAGLKALDRLLASCATHVMADSPSQKTFLVDEGVVEASKVTVLGEGSISGVDVTRFKPDQHAREKIREELCIDKSAIVFLYMARVTRDKGVLDLAHAFAQVSVRMPNAFLIVIGPDEDGIESELQEIFRHCQHQLRRIEFTYQPEAYMAASDVFCIPSYREGFSSATIQAAGSGCAAIASRIYGLTDAVVDGRTGIFHSPGSVEEIAAALYDFYSNDDLRIELGAQAHSRAHARFSQRLIVDEMVSFVKSRVACN